MMDASQLDRADVMFFVMRDAGQPVAMGAIKRLDAAHGEVKSMHVLAERRGQGLSKRMLQHLVAAARGAGLARLSLETGVQPMFTPARLLYEKAGFAPCPPFGSYVADPNSLFMTCDLANLPA
jgi:putative acetyltransferase